MFVFLLIDHFERGPTFAVQADIKEEEGAPLLQRILKVMPKLKSISLTPKFVPPMIDLDALVIEWKHVHVQSPSDGEFVKKIKKATRV